MLFFSIVMKFTWNDEYPFKASERQQAHKTQQNADSECEFRQLIEWKNGRKDDPTNAQKQRD